MANHKAPEADSVPTELLKYCGPQGRELHLIPCNLVHDRDCIPHGWREGILLSMRKSWDLTNRPDYPGLTLLPTITKFSLTCCYRGCALMSSSMITSAVSAVGAVLLMPASLWMPPSAQGCREANRVPVRPRLD
jgi:hypothetical protein